MANVIVTKPQTIMVVPDSHAHPDFSNERYDWLAELILDVKPDVVVDIGDWFDMPSLCSYDKGTKGFEGRRYNKDIEAGVEAQDRIRQRLKKAKKKLPRFVRMLGNHENRINRAVNEDAVLDGVISMKDLQSKEYGWEEYPFQQTVDIGGIDFAHYFTSGIMGRPIGGEHPGYTLLSKRHKSSTQGHAHTYDHAVRTRGNQHIHGLVVGVYSDYHMDYAGPANQLWRSQIVIKRNVCDGDYDLETINIRRLRDAYGS
jgi:hypothetical protein